MRPSIVRLAQARSLVGYVRNTHDGVEVHVEGPAQSVDRFIAELPANVTDAARVSSLESTHAERVGYESFRVLASSDSESRSADSTTSGQVLPLSAHVPQDVAVCSDCLREVQDNSDRRNRYPFTSCTVCGPRYSIIERMPYDRSQTSMSAFPLCTKCLSEYESVEDRRFHAQTNACPECGPQVWLCDADDNILARKHDAIAAAAAALLDGHIVSMRGVGGYQLLADATSNDAVERLRRRKQRHDKPLAVMVGSTSEATSIASLSQTERQLLNDPANPIVVVDLAKENALAKSVTSGLNTIGLMLPTSPLHWLLLDAVQRPLVCTSGNLEGDPLIYEALDARSQLRDIADLWLEHDRPIERPIDDSVVRVIANRPATIRAGRGYAPMSLDVLADEPLIALGGHQKTSLALCNGMQSVLGPHLGDLNSLQSRQRYVQQFESLTELYGVDDCTFACDLHPDYFTSRLKQHQSNNITQVQHHHAHIVAGMCEHGWLDRQVLGVAFDGTGYGNDRTIWGGEFLVAGAVDFERVGSLRPFSLPGGELAVRQPWRVATALVREAAGDEQAAKLRFDSGDARALVQVLQRPRLSPVTTSAGRLFDGIATLILGIEESSFEGQPAMLLEAICNDDPQSYVMPLQNTRPRQLDWREVVKQVLHDRATGVHPGSMAMRFHRALANAIVEFCRGYAPMPVVLGGGVFQNRVLVELLAEKFAKTDQQVGLPGLIPTNDGGLAVGQLAVAAARSRRRRTTRCV